MCIFNELQMHICYQNVQMWFKVHFSVHTEPSEKKELKFQYRKS